MAAFKVPLKIDQGSTFKKLVTWKTGTPATPVDLTGCTALAHVRETLPSPGVLIAMSTANGNIALGGTAGTVQITLSDEETAAFTWSSAVYDLEISFPDGTVRRLMCGSVSVSPEVTRA